MLTKKLTEKTNTEKEVTYTNRVGNKTVIVCMLLFASLFVVMIFTTRTSYIDIGGAKIPSGSINGVLSVFQVAIMVYVTSVEKRTGYAISLSVLMAYIIYLLIKMVRTQAIDILPGLATLIFGVFMVYVVYKNMSRIANSEEALYKLGEAPLPSFINRLVEEDDAERFQTIFAKHEGAVTAPTAGLHFSRELMKRMEIKGIDFAFITMHAGLGNFREIDVEDLTKHKMDSEQMFVEADACRIVNKAVDEGRRICAVGTTVMRTIETAVGTDGHLKEFEGWTNKFIFPPYDFSVANSMVTNFHLPYSTLLMLVAAYGGYDLIMNAYDIALKEDYRFGTYGDAMLILDK